MSNGQVIWITGLSGAGKTTLATELVAQMKTLGQHVVMLDGDELRKVFGAVENNSRNHGREGRLALSMQYSQLCLLLAGQGLTVVIATISLFKEIHEWNRKILPNYYEVYIKVPLDELLRRDTKGIYKRFESGELKNVAGLDLPIDEPKSADWVVEFVPGRSVLSLAQEMNKILISRRINDKKINAGY